jgi:hypothetical protein
VCHPAVQYGGEGAAVPGESLWSSPTAGRNASAAPSLAAAGQHTLAARSECLLHRQRVSSRRAHPPSPHRHLSSLALHVLSSRSHHLPLLSLVCPSLTLLSVISPCLHACLPSPVLCLHALLSLRMRTLFPLSLFPLASSFVQELCPFLCRRAPLGSVSVHPQPSGLDSSFVKHSCAVQLIYVWESARANGCCSRRGCR